MSNASRWTKGSARVFARPPKVVDLDILDDGEVFGVRRLGGIGGPRWRLIHLPTGMSLHTYRRRKDARGVAEEIADQAGEEWRRGTFGEAPEGEVKEKMLAALDQVDVMRIGEVAS